MTIREYAKSRGVTVIGKLTRKPEYETMDFYYPPTKVYEDEGGNRYSTSDGNVSIVDTEGTIY